jgi:hypothetical protein
MAIGLVAALVGSSAAAAPATLSDSELDRVAAGGAGDLQDYQNELLAAYIVPYLRLVLARLEMVDPTEQLGWRDLQAFLRDFDAGNGSGFAIQARMVGPPASGGSAAAAANIIESPQRRSVFDVMSLGGPATDRPDITISTFETSDSAGATVRIEFSIDDLDGRSITVPGGVASASMN